jgi:hypothetical protein
MILYFLCVIPFIAPIIYLTKEAFCTFENPDQIEFAKYWYYEVPVPKLFLTITFHKPRETHAAYMFSLMVSAYLLIVVFARMTLFEIKRKATNMSPKTKALHDQLAR